MLIFAALYVILLASLQNYASHDKKVSVRLAAYFGILFAAMGARSSVQRLR